MKRSRKSKKTSAVKSRCLIFLPVRAGNGWLIISVYMYIYEVWQKADFRNKFWSVFRGICGLNFKIMRECINRVYKVY